MSKFRAVEVRLTPNSHDLLSWVLYPLPADRFEFVFVFELDS